MIPLNKSATHAGLTVQCTLGKGKNAKPKYRTNVRSKRQAKQIIKLIEKTNKGLASEIKSNIELIDIIKEEWLRG